MCRLLSQDMLNEQIISAAIGNVRNHGPELIERLNRSAGGDVVNNG
ncbi:hypothetical protein [Pseudomonas sp. KCJK8993]